MKKILLLFILTTFLLVGCTDPWKNRDLSFSEGFAELKKIDAKYNTSFTEERLNSTMVSLDNIEPLIEDLEEFRENVRKTKDSEDKAAVIDLVAVRITMVLAQENFQRAQSIGDIGRTNDEAGFSCSEIPYMLEASFYYNKTLAYTTKARSDLDTILYNYRKVPQLQQLLGTDDEKVKFYYFNLDSVSNILRTNDEAITDICKAKVVKNAP